MEESKRKCEIMDSDICKPHSVMPQYYYYYYTSISIAPPHVQDITKVHIVDSRY